MAATTLCTTVYRYGWMNRKAELQSEGNEMRVGTLDATTSAKP